jgi:hypothetical protein
MFVLIEIYCQVIRVCKRNDVCQFHARITRFSPTSTSSLRRSGAAHVIDRIVDFRQAPATAPLRAGISAVAQPPNLELFGCPQANTTLE